MRYLKRFVFLLIILGCAFGVYRLISPNAAKSLMNDLQFLVGIRSVSVDSGSMFDSGIIDTSLTGTVSLESGTLQELSREDEKIVSDLLQEQETDENTGTVVSDSDTSLSPSSSSASSTSSVSHDDGLSSQDYRDFTTLFGK